MGLMRLKGQATFCRMGGEAIRGCALPNTSFSWMDRQAFIESPHPIGHIVNLL